MAVNLSVNAGRCIHCGLCVADCNPRSLELSPDTRIPRWTATGEARCFKCQHCFAICPSGAIAILDASPENAEENRGVPAARDLLNLIKCRRSCRSYKPEDVARDVVDRLKTMLAWSPTGVNDHRLYFSFIDTIEVMNPFRKKFLSRLSELIENKVPGSESFARYSQRLLDGDDIVFRGAPHMLLVCTPKDAPCADIDPVIALSYFELYAQTLGLGTLWCGLFKWGVALMPEFLECFRLPEGYVPGYAMMFGYPKVKYARATLPAPALTFSVEP